MATQISMEISPAEFQSNSQQFAALNPQMGKIDGVAVRNVLLKSNLPAQILAQIWALSDLDRDGMMDIREFSIAMRLTRNCMAGAPLPSVLPPSLLQVPGQMPMQHPNFPSVSGYGGMVMSAPPMAIPSSVPIGMSASSIPSSPPMPVMSGSPAMMQSLPGYGHGAIGAPPPQPPRPGPAPAGYSNGTTTPTPMSSAFPGKQCGNWAVPHQAKLKFSQQFNQLDKQRLGFLSAQVARNALGMSGLPTPALAHIWNLSDVNKDGRLNVDEFYIAMHLIDMYKGGYALPEITPPELAQMCAVSRSANNSPMLEPGAPPAQKSPAPKTFEDKRMDNYAKGQAELERRRQILMEEENRRKAEIEKREREEAEKRERERLEKERRREAERQAELERQRQAEEARMEEHRRIEAEREAARKEAERQRMIEAEKQKIRDLQNLKQQEAEKTAQRQQRQKTLGFQLQAMDEKAADTDAEIAKARERIKEITHEIEGMRDQRDEKMKRISELQATNQQLSIQAQEIAHQLLQFQSANKETANRKSELEATIKRRDAARANVEQLKAKLEQLRQRSTSQNEATQKKQAEADETRRNTEAAIDEYRRVLTLMAQTQIQARAKLAEGDAAMAAALQEQEQKQQQQQLVKQSSSTGSGGFTHDPFAAAPPVSTAPTVTSPSHHSAAANALPASSASTTGKTKYRALFEFVARTEDELSFQPGDIILVFEGGEGDAAEPGWRAGQIRDKVGWFPEAFAEPIAPVNPIAQPIQNMPPNVTPSPSLDQIPEEAVSKSGVLESPQRVGTVPATSDAVICQCVALFPWKARNDDDLSFAKGDSIEVLQQLDMKWRGRKADGTVGWFPKSYVKVQSSSTACSNSKPSSAAQSLDQTTPIAGSPAGTPSASKRESISSNVAIPTSASKHSLQSQGKGSAVPSTTSGEWYVALYAFEATEPTDLSLNVGDKILVLEQNDAWWKGRIDGREGTFPGNYVEKLGNNSVVGGHAVSAPSIICRVRAVADFEASAANQLSLKIGEEIGVREKSDAGWWEGEVIRNGQALAGWFPGEYVVPIEEEVITPGKVSAKALYDYTACQGDELTFRTGDIIVIDQKVDDQWWAGHLPSAPTQKGLFPASYVQESHTPILYSEPPSLYELPPLEGTSTSKAAPAPMAAMYDVPPSSSTYQPALYDEPPVPPPVSEKFKQLAAELQQTEERYLGDLVLAKKLFYLTLVNVVHKNELKKIFLNWEELIDLSKRIVARMKRGDGTASIFLAEIDAMSAFVTFCKNQQSAVDSISTVLSSPEARSLYSQCCASPHARGMTLNTFILLPLGRVTRYPLLVEKMLKESQSPAEQQDLDAALQLLRALVGEVNRGVSEMDTLGLLCWAQHHIKCPGIMPSIEFTSPTRRLGNRQFLHSSVLYKARSGRQLVGLLFNDFLLLTTPDETLHEGDSFKVSKTAEARLTLYRHPLLIEHLRLETNKEPDNLFSLIYGEDVVNLRCTSNSAAKLWTNQIQQAIDLYSIAIADQGKSTFCEAPKGRLLVELVNSLHFSTKTMGTGPHVAKLVLGNQSEQFEFDIAKQEMKLTTQFPFWNYDNNFTLTIYQKRTFCPDVMVLEPATVPLKDLVNHSTKHHGPLAKPMAFRKKGPKNIESIVVKFVVQLFESDI